MVKRHKTRTRCCICLKAGYVSGRAWWKPAGDPKAIRLPESGFWNEGTDCMCEPCRLKHGERSVGRMVFPTDQERITEPYREIQRKHIYATEMAYHFGHI